MWTDVRWRAPLLESETRVLREVVSNLQLAHSLDPALECPIEEWNEILDHLGIEATAPTLRTPKARSTRRIGYRRNMVRVALVAGWTIQIPGAFADTWDEDTWCSWDSEVTVWFTAFKSAVDGAPASASKLLGEFEPDGDDVINYERGELAGKGSISFVQEEDYWRLRARSAGAGRFCLCTICFKDLARRQLALQIWQSVAL